MQLSVPQFLTFQLEILIFDIHIKRILKESMREYLIEHFAIPEKRVLDDFIVCWKWQL